MVPHRPPLSVIILNWNDSRTLFDCLDSLQACAVEGMETLVVDQGSTDGSVERIAREHADIRLVRLPDNRGVAGGRNAGMAEARGERCLFLDSDVVVLPRALEALMAFLDSRPDVGLVGARLVFPDGSRQTSCGYPQTMWRQLLYWTGVSGALKHRLPRVSQYLEYEYDEAHEVGWVAGACQLFRRQVWEAAGPLDESLFYTEDMEWCYRIRKRGWRIYRQPAAVLVHHLGVSGVLWNEHVLEAAASLPKFYAKHYDRMAVATYFVLAVAGLCGRLGLHLALARLTRSPNHRPKAIWCQRLLLALCGSLSRLPRPEAT